MSIIWRFSALALALLAGCSALPGSVSSQADEHAAHHPSRSVAATPTPAGYDHQMKMMQDMHRKMAEAKTPDARAALMKDHMKTMQDGMAMAGQMRGGMMGDGKTQMPMDPATMQQRMDMMESMMQMMMDRDAMKAPAAK